MAARMEGARRRLEAEHDASAWHAWHVAALTRAKDLPDLKSILSSKPQADQTPEQQEVALDQMFLAWGGDPADLARVKAERAAHGNE